MRTPLRALVGPLLLLLAAGARADCAGAGKRAAAAACSAYPVLCWHERESCSSSADGRHISLRYAPRQLLERDRRHYEVSCWENAPRDWWCAQPRVTRTGQLSDAGDWAELLGDVSLARAREVADLARAELAPAATDVESVAAGDTGYFVGLNVAGETHACLSFTPRDGGLAGYRVGSC